MKIEADDTPLASAMLYLTVNEAAELRDLLTDLIDRFDEDDFHGHVAGTDYQTELTVVADRSVGSE